MGYNKVRYSIICIFGVQFAGLVLVNASPKPTATRLGAIVKNIKQKDMKNITALLLTLMSMNLFGQSDVKTALKYWERGEIKEAYYIAENILKHFPDNDTAIFIKMKALFVHGKYKETIETASSIKKTFEKYSDAVNVVIESYLHLQDYKGALEFAETNKSERTSYLKELEEKPFTVIADKTYIIPFIQDSNNTSNFIPLIHSSKIGIGL